MNILAITRLEGVMEDSSEPCTTSKRQARAARKDATVGAIKKKIEKHFALPEGSIVIVDVNGRAIRNDARIATVRKRWEEG